MNLGELFNPVEASYSSHATPQNPAPPHKVGAVGLGGAPAGALMPQALTRSCSLSSEGGLALGPGSDGKRL